MGVRKQETRSKSRCRINILFLVSCLLFLHRSEAQQKNMPLNREWNLGVERYIQHGGPISCGVNLKDSTHFCHQPVFFTSFRPLNEDQIIQYYAYDQKTNGDLFSKRRISRKIFTESLLIVNDTADKFHLAIDPLFNFQFGKDLADKKDENLYVNTRGFLVRGSIGKKFSFESSFYENQATYAQYIDDYIKSTNKLFPQTANYNYAVVPGQGRSKPFHGHGYDYGMASGYISYSPVKMVNVQVGTGKHFVGDGYRSLLLSDNAFNYPFARITTTYKNIQYINLYTSFMNLTDGGVKTPAHVERLFQKKTGSFQLLSFNLFKRLQISLFQGMIWEAADSTNKEHVSFNTFDPVIGVNAATYGLHNKNNVLLGVTLKLKIANSISLYGQYMMDDVYSKTGGGDIRKKNGYQIGLKYFDLFTIKNLHLQLEYNTVRPYSYAAANSEQSYTHYNQSLAHPLGANFYEMVGFINYRLKDFFIELKGNYAVKGADSTGYNAGGNIFRSDNSFPISQTLSNVYTTQGERTAIMYEDVHIGYLVNPSTNFNILIGISYRTEKTASTVKNTQFVYFGIRTSLSNFYYDF